MSSKLDKIFGKKDSFFIRVMPGDVVMPKKYTEIADEIHNFSVKSDDTWLISYPRTGKWRQKKNIPRKFQKRKIKLMIGL